MNNKCCSSSSVILWVVIGLIVGGLIGYYLGNKCMLFPASSTSTTVQESAA
ncbi:MAG: hypothetical protein WA432_02800 [Candidatus Babeliaceae bacterium]